MKKKLRKEDFIFTAIPKREETKKGSSVKDTEYLESCHIQYNVEADGATYKLLSISIEDTLPIKERERSRYYYNFKYANIEAKKEKGKEGEEQLRILYAEITIYVYSSVRVTIQKNQANQNSFHKRGFEEAFYPDLTWQEVQKFSLAKPRIIFQRLHHISQVPMPRDVAFPIKLMKPDFALLLEKGPQSKYPEVFLGLIDEYDIDLEDYSKWIEVSFQGLYTEIRFREQERILRVFDQHFDLMKFPQSYQKVKVENKRNSVLEDTYEKLSKEMQWAYEKMTDSRNWLQVMRGNSPVNNSYKAPPQFGPLAPNESMLRYSEAIEKAEWIQSDPKHLDLDAIHEYQINYEGNVFFLGLGLKVESEDEADPDLDPEPADFNPLWDERSTDFKLRLVREGKDNEIEFDRSYTDYCYIYQADLVEKLGELAIGLGIGILPIIGDIYDISELIFALSSGRDFFGNEVTADDITLMALFALIPLVPNKASAFFKEDTFDTVKDAGNLILFSGRNSTIKTELAKSNLTTTGKK